jgi:hypothetical protein
MAMPAFAHLFGCFAGRPSLSRGRASRCSRLPQRTRAGTVAAAVTCNSRPPWTVDVDGVKDDLLYDLETRLHDAVELENFEVARTTRDEITRLQSGAFVDVLQAYMAFYRAFDSQSIVDIAKVLAQDVTTCKHPIGRAYLRGSEGQNTRRALPCTSGPNSLCHAGLSLCLSRLPPPSSKPSSSATLRYGFARRRRPSASLVAMSRVAKSLPRCAVQNRSSTPSDHSSRRECRASSRRIPGSQCEGASLMWHAKKVSPLRPALPLAQEGLKAALALLVCLDRAARSNVSKRALSLAQLLRRGKRRARKLPTPARRTEGRGTLATSRWSWLPSTSSSSAMASTCLRTIRAALAVPSTSRGFGDHDGKEREKKTSMRIGPSQPAGRTLQAGHAQSPRRRLVHLRAEAC